MTITIKGLNDLPEQAFVATFGDVAEHSPWVMEHVVRLRPFTSLRGVHQAVMQVLGDASSRQQTALICAHPDLAGKAARAGDMTDASVSEQSGVGLDRMSDEEFETFERLNAEYKTKFGFPFIIAVKGHDKTSILNAFAARLNHDKQTESREAIAQIGEIMRYRLESMIVHDE